ncbi:MAG TPA: hypothetical protein VD931_07165, partial [Baekduia sp.]|nr:hypothetical protein [Baekduia sp.]
ALALGDPQFVNVIRTGWYVDDIRLVRGTFREIGRTSEKSFTVAGKRKGTYGYRVRAVFNDGITSAPSNLASVVVTRGVPDSGERCATASGFTRARVARAKGGGLRFDLRLTGAPAVVEIFRAADGRRVVRRRVARFERRGSFTWDGRVRGRRLPSGLYYAKLRTAQRPRGTDTRFVTLRRTSRGFTVAPAFRRTRSCGLLSRAELNHPAFSASRRLVLGYATTQPARVTVTVRRGSRVVRRLRTRTTRANRAVRVTLPQRGLRPGTYRVVVEARKGRERRRATLTARRL